MTDDHHWWKEAVVYQIYPRSFNDSDGDGIGDIPGITEKLDYLEELGVDVVWLNPCYQSPQKDNGYDIADYRAIHDEYGDMGDWEELLDGLHERDMKLIMDLAFNHTSDQHVWFQKSREGDEEYADYYVWKDPEDGGLPNNWRSGFGGPAWKYDEEREAYYLHLFHESQPDLNWENPDVREEIHEMMRWWLEKGIDGFRLDVVNLLSKPQEFPDGDPDVDWTGIEHFARGPRLEEYLQGIHDEALADYDVVTVGETVDVTMEEAERYTQADGPLDMVFHFEHVTLDFHHEEGWWRIHDWDLTTLKSIFSRWQTDFEGWNAVYLGNHDWPRIASRFGNDEAYRKESAKLLATLLLTLRGTTFVYQGDEIGMTNYPFESIDQMNDVQTLGNVEERLEDGMIESPEEALDIARYRTRDNARTPIQWSDAEYGGFSTTEPWLPVNPNHDEVNAADAREDPDSVFTHYRELIDLRHEWDTLVYGDYTQLAPGDEQVWAYSRTSEDGDDAIVVLNFSDDPATPDLGIDASGAQLVTNNYPSDPAPEDDLEPYEARVYRI